MKKELSENNKKIIEACVTQMKEAIGVINTLIDAGIVDNDIMKDIEIKVGRVLSDKNRSTILAHAKSAQQIADGLIELHKATEQPPDTSSISTGKDIDDDGIEIVGKSE